MRARMAGVVLGLAALGGVAAGCGGGGDGGGYKEPAGASIATVHVDAGNLFFDPKDPTAPAGIVTIELKDTQSGPHTLVLKGVSGFKLSVSDKGDVDRLKVDLEAGSYEFWCTIPGHRAAGMDGTLTVR